MNNQDYPWGADNSDAPWNQGDDPMKECPKCLGTGSVCTECEEGSESCCCNVNDAPDLKDCPNCGGLGEVFDEDYDDEPDPDMYEDDRYND